MAAAAAAVSVLLAAVEHLRMCPGVLALPAVVLHLPGCRGLGWLL